MLESNERIFLKCNKVTNRKQAHSNIAYKKKCSINTGKAEGKSVFGVF